MSLRFYSGLSERTLQRDIVASGILMGLAFRYMYKIIAAGAGIQVHV